MRLRAGLALLAVALGARPGCKRSPEPAPVVSAQPEDAVADRGPGWRVSATHAGHQDRIGFRGGPNARAVDWTSVGSVVLREAWTGERLATLVRQSARPRFAVLSPDASRLLFGRADQVLELWDARRGTRITTLGRIGERGVPVVAADNLTAVAFVDGQARVYDLSNGTVRHSLTGGRGELVVAPDGSRAMLGEDLWDLERGSRIAALDGWIEKEHGFSFSPSSDFVMATRDRTARLWRASDGAPFWAAPAPTDVEDPGPFARTWWGPSAVLVAWAQTAGIYNLGDGELGVAVAPPETVAFSPDGRHVAVARPSDLEVLELATGRREQSLAGPVGGVWYDNEGRLLVERADGDRAEALGLKTVRLREQGMSKRGRLSADGSHFFVEETDARGRTGDEAQIVAVPSGQRVEPSPGPRFSHATFVDEGRVLALGETAELWTIDGDDLEHATSCPELSTRTEGVSVPLAVAFDRGRRVLVNTSGDVIELRVGPDSCEKIRRVDLGSDVMIADLRYGAPSLTSIPTQKGLNWRWGWILQPDGAGFSAWGTNGIEPGSPKGLQEAIPWPDGDEEVYIASASWTIDRTQLALLDEEGDLWVWRSGAESIRHVAAAVPLRTADARLALAGPYAFVSAGKAVHAVPFQEGSTREARTIPLASAMHRSQDGERIAVSINELGGSHVRVYASADFKELVDVATPLRAIDSVSFSPSGNRIVAAGGGLVVIDGPAR